MSEAAIENRFVRWCQKQNIPCLKLAIVNGRGWPDRTVLLPDGRIVFLEFKRPDGDGKVSAQQRATIAQLKALGHVAEVVESFERAVSLVVGMV